jgi:hypothetical protein
MCVLKLTGSEMGCSIPDGGVSSSGGDDSAYSVAAGQEDSAMICLTGREVWA